MENTYTVKQLAALAGVSVRTLHHYDACGLLKPGKRSPAGYRLYGPYELYRLQQIMFYKELDFPLENIAAILDDPDFELTPALEAHEKALQARRDRISTLLETIHKTLEKLKGGPVMLTDKDLYEGFPKGNTYREEAVAKWGREAVEKSENNLRKLDKAELLKLRSRFDEIRSELGGLMHLPASHPKVQKVIHTHFELIKRFWGETVPEAERLAAYAGLAKLYINDERYTQTPDGKSDPAYAAFIAEGMTYYSTHPA
ncbi:MerR family transcriptional regulator [Chitinophaga lutea]|uniref:MerR family transcriptional regulator n=1 Tax=Chitinophaga lutea TaxID=2488634 RepID=A0A3N4PX93_9BACT|nr:MerR family transcriptional regulator [Chitinophaga lutea]RPE09761.1 MerR family transcriptional regulator [Chitinophaga lutea]